MFARTTRGFSLAGAMADTSCVANEDRYLFLDRFLHSSWDSNEPFLGASNVISRPVKSQVQVSIFCIKTNQWKSCYVENVCLEHKPNMNILVSFAGKPGSVLRIILSWFILIVDLKENRTWSGSFFLDLSCQQQLCEFHPCFMKIGL